MTQILRWLAGLMVAALLAACGGGGGSPGATSNGTGSGPAVTPASPTLTLALVNASDTPVSGNLVTAAPSVFAKAVLKDAAGVPIANKLVSFSLGSAVATFTPAGGQVLTDANGVAKIPLAPTPGTSGGGTTLAVAVTLPVANNDPIALTTQIDIQVQPAAAASPTLALSLVDGTGATIAGNAVASGATVFAKAIVRDAGGAPVSNKLVTFVLSSNVATMTPPTGQVLTDASGVARVQLAPTPGTAGGGMTITASASVAGSTGTNIALSTPLDITVQSTPAPAPTLGLSIVNASGAVVTNNSVTNGTVVFARAIVADSTGAPVANKLVVFSSATGLFKFQPVNGQVLTDASGVAKVQLTPATITTAGAETVTATSSVGTVNLSAGLDVQTSAANVTLTAFNATQTTLTPFQSTPVTVNVSVNGTPATTTPVQVTFTANCGTFSPAQTTSNSSGQAITTFQAAGCAAGNATLSATAQGATSSANTNLTILAAAPTNLLFSSASPSTIYTLQAAFGVKQSTVKFKVVDASGNGVGPSVGVKVSLGAPAIASGVVFADTGTTTPETLTTDVNGEIVVIVKSGTVPTPLSVNAALVSNPLISASSAGLSVNSGRPVQTFFSLSVDKQAVEGFGIDNQVVNLQVLVADRLGQPVPANTPISFITEGGQVTASCLLVIDTNGKSGCTVSLVTQQFKPTNGRVTVLAYAEGDEPFIDANGNNKWDPGELFVDMGQPFLDVNEDGTYTPAIGDQKVGNSANPGSGIGTLACPVYSPAMPNVAGTCDGVWGSTLVRQQVVLAFSTSVAAPAVFTNIGPSGFRFFLQDLNGNGMAAGTTVSTAISGGTNCTLQDIIPGTAPATTPNPTLVQVVISKGQNPTDTCVGATVTVKAASPSGTVTQLGSVLITP